MYTTLKPGLGRLPWILSAVAAILAIALYALNHRSARGPGDTTVLKIGKSIPAWKPGPGWASATPPARQPGEPIRIPIYPPWSEREGKVIFAPTSVEIIDPLAGKLFKPNLDFEQSFPEHPSKSIRFTVNSRSMREDGEPRAEKPLLRVLVAGDSHTDGVCNNSESFPNLAEAALRERAAQESRTHGLAFDPTSIEVLNAGKGGHSFYNYLGVLEKNLDLKPDVFVVTVYGGNDFDEVLTVWHFYNNQGQRPVGAAKYKELIDAAAALKISAPSQALGQVKYFSEYPEQKEIAVKAGVEVLGQIQALCKERGIRLIVLYLPSWPDVEPDNPDLSLRKLLRLMELPAASIASTNELADKLLSSLEPLGIETIDLRPAFKASKRSLYWRADWHINLAGHRVVAEQLVKALSARG